MGIKHYLCGVLNHSFNPSHIVRKNGGRFSDSQKQKKRLPHSRDSLCLFNKNNYMTPWSSIAWATFMNPAILAPFT